MKVLWYVNIVMPNAAKALGIAPTNAGGWLTGAAEGLQKEKIQLLVMTATGLVKEATRINDGVITYILVPAKGYETHFEAVICTEKPDLVHINGTEYAYNTYLIRLCDNLGLKHVVSLQGLVYQCAKHYDDGLPERYKKVNPLLKLMKKLYAADSIALEKKRFAEQGEREIEALKVAGAVIGRTAWDKASVLEINPELEYYHVNESLRDAFYTEETWQYCSCEKHSIFISQASYPIKGIHMLLSALPAIIQKYPDLKVYVGGFAPVYRKNKYLDCAVDFFFEYQRYIKELIKQYSLERYVCFTGPLTAEKMKVQFLKSNVFLSCSTIENSPNSVGEAMLLGVPVVASRVGGTENMLTDGKDGILYDFHDTERMINAISEIFDRQDLAEQFSASARLRAQITHDRNKNTAALYAVYQKMITEDC